MKIRSNIFQYLAWLLISFFILIFTVVILWFLLLVLFGFLFLKLLGEGTNEGLLVPYMLSIAGSFLSIPLSLYPSYKISLWLSRKVKDWWGWEIEKPKRLFWLSVLLIILLVFVLPFVVNSLF